MHIELIKRREAERSSWENYDEFEEVFNLEVKKIGVLGAGTIPGVVTTDDVVQTVIELSGFIVNRILVPYMNEAANVFHEGIASAAEIDKAMKLGAGMPMGPLELADLVGIDIVLAVCEFFVKEFADSKYRPSLAFRQKVRAGHLGKKTGKGFYDYSK